MNDMREEIELPELETDPELSQPKYWQYRCAEREAQLKAAIRDLLIAKDGADRAVEIGLELAKREAAANQRAENAEAANREKDAEIARLTALEFTLQAQRDLLFGVVKAIADAEWRKWDDGLNTPQDFIAWAKSIASAAVSDAEKLASLRASVGEKWIEIKELLQAFTESEHNHLKYCRESVYYPGLGTQDDRCELCKRADKLLAPPSTDKES